jgi:hypothetical protein
MRPDFHRLAQDAPTMADRLDVYAAEQREQAQLLAEQAEHLRSELAHCEGRAARAAARAKGHTFRSRELRYDANGGMTEELARRRFEPGARWSVDGEECAVVCRDESGLRVDSDRWTDGMFVRAAEMTRENGWLFLDLGEDAGGRVPPGGWPDG